MGIFDFFRKNNPVDTQVEKIDAPIKSKATKIVVRQKPEFRIHNDLMYRTLSGKRINNTV